VPENDLVRSLVTVDVGNTRLKLGVFDFPLGHPLPHPRATISVEHNWEPAEIDAFLSEPPAAYEWAIASVNKPARERLVSWLEERGAESIHRFDYGELPIAVEVEQPERVGADRLVNGVAVNRLREPGVPAIIIDMGTALTVDVISAAGAFVGGAIAPGVATSARALHEYTYALPLVEVSASPPPALGRSTAEALVSGLYWGAVGAVRELIRKLGEEIGEAEIYLTGGAGTLLASVLTEEGRRPPQFIPHLTLAGIAIAAADAADGSD
jgi:type III pantothenate kinase